MILLCTLKLCIKPTLIDIVFVVDINYYIRTPNKSWKIPKFYPLEINYFSTSCESTYNVIVDSVAQLADINILDELYIDS